LDAENPTGVLPTNTKEKAMSKIKYTTLDQNKDWLFDASDVSLLQHTLNKAVYADNETGDRWLLKGSNLQYDMSGALASGTITQVQELDNHGRPFVTYSNFSFDVAAGKPLFETENNLFLAVVHDNDKLIGSKGADYMNAGPGNDHSNGGKGNDDLRGEDGNDVLNGGAGNDFIWAGRDTDTMTGGTGDDMFQYLHGEGHDTITDFNVNDDTLSADYDGIVSIKKSGHDTVIDFGDGDTLTLLNIKPQQVTEDIFI
jgi:Ca2+-binding RTX toxin-like protein